MCLMQINKTKLRTIPNLNKKFNRKSRRWRSPIKTNQLIHAIKLISNHLRSRWSKQSNRTKQKQLQQKTPKKLKKKLKPIISKSSQKNLDRRMKERMTKTSIFLMPISIWIQIKMINQKLHKFKISSRELSTRH